VPLKYLPLVYSRPSFVRIRRNDCMATVAVIDRGVGISPVDQVKLFTRFGRVQTTQHVQGTVSASGTVQSDVGSESTFVLAVPLRR